MRCKYCQKNHLHFSGAHECAREHRRNKDRFWEEAQRQEGLRKLAKAARLPGQQKLFQEN